MPAVLVAAGPGGLPVISPPPRQFHPSRTLPTMSQPMWIPDPAGASAAGPFPRAATRGAVAAALAVAAATALLGLAAGFGWAALAPRVQLVMTSPHAAAVVNPETSAFIAADAVYCALGVAGGAVSGLGAFLLAVRRWGPLPMAGLLAGAVAAAFLARWLGELNSLAAFHQLLATQPPGARLPGPLKLGANSGLAFWPLTAGLVAGGLAALTGREPAGAADGW